MPKTHPRMVWYEFSWIAAVGMITFLVAAACGSPVVMLAGAMMWGGFSLAARQAGRPLPARAGAAGRTPACLLPRAGDEPRGAPGRERRAAIRSNLAR